MTYRNLTIEQLSSVRSLAKYLCDKQGLKTISDFKRIGNEIIDEVETGTKKFITDCEGKVFIVKTE